jgi:two-component sensor histidine kinase
LIVNELITNSCKHAFPGISDGKIEVSFIEEGDFYIMSVSDNGIGIHGDINNGKSSSLGLQLVTFLARQIRGTFLVKSEKGTIAEIRFPKERVDGKIKNTDS